MLNFHHVVGFPRSHHICDVIKQNESEVEKYDFGGFFFGIFY